MAKFMCSVTYSADGAKGLIKDGGSKRKEVVIKALNAIGGSLEAFYFTLGEHDVVLICDVPDAVSGVALSLAVNSSGAARLALTQLITPAEMDAASKKTTVYTVPGA